MHQGRGLGRWLVAGLVGWLGGPGLAQASGGCGTGHLPPVGFGGQTSQIAAAASHPDKPRTAAAGLLRFSMFNEFGRYNTIIADGERVRNPLDREADINVTTFAMDYGLGDRLSLSLQVPYVSKLQHIRDHENASVHRRHPTGLGDISVGFTYQLLPGSLLDEGYGLLSSFGVSLPTGSTDKYHGSTLPPAFQMGTGTYEARPAAVFYASFGSLVWYEAFSARIPLRRNESDYRFGKEYSLTSGLLWALPQLDRRLRLRFEVQVSRVEKDNMSRFSNRFQGRVVNPVLLESDGDVSNTGGLYVYAGPGVECDLTDRISLSLSALFPLLRDSNGDKSFRNMKGFKPRSQVAADYLIFTSVSFAMDDPLQRFRSPR